MTPTGGKRKLLQLLNSCNSSILTHFLTARNIVEVRLLHR